MDTEQARLGWADYTVIALTMGVSAGVGVFYRFSGGRQRTTREYFSADNSMGVPTVAVALMVSFMSAITLLGLSTESYTYGAQFAAINLAYVIGTPVISYCYAPVFFNLGAVSAYEYLERRFGRAARLAASFASWLQLLLYCGVVLYAPALALEATTGLPGDWSVVAVGLVCTFYSCVGGIKAVLVTDLFQALLMFASLLVVVAGAAQRVGGLGAILRIAAENGRVQFDSFSPDPTVRHTWWGLLLGGLFIYVSVFGVNQVQVQRMMTLRDAAAARRAFLLNLPFLCGLSLLTCFSGLAIYSYYYDCDPLLAGRIDTPDMLMPRYVMDSLSHLPGVAGLFVAGILSASLSTMSAGLNSLAVITLEDYAKPAFLSCAGRPLSETRSLALGKLLTLLYGLACLALAFGAKLLGGVLQASLTIFGAVGGPLLGVFTLGMLLERADQTGAVVGLLASLAFTLWMAFGQPKPLPLKLPLSVEGCDAQFLAPEVLRAASRHSPVNDEDQSQYFYLYRISYVWYGAIGFAVTILVGIVVSLLSRATRGDDVDEEELDPNLFFPIVARRIRRRRTRHLKTAELNERSH
ncbi:putative sodium-dependent multivitamin transporter [Phymastichus coffea]|uniref:putative sodium-dependent multivitamin transporter n=1 Tax=Phymastichus coffea TaxID=108790 RepID=UPI00273CDB09|nr:putative sodium-dependent multivitamin transporter [Phymastichus coffea]XP_058802926.1 putative sodium-dependent multivitamin transporter [Phymastichus coffea]